MDAILPPRMHLALSRRALRGADDVRLVAQVRAGSRSAFEAVYDRHHPGILAFCRHMLASREEAEDVVQHTFAAAYQALLVDEREIALKAWLYAIARNRCLSVLRARREHVALEDADSRLPSTAGLSAEVEQREDLRALLGDLQRLPDDQRAALVLTELGTQSHEEIAVILCVPTSKVKALVFQAREALMTRRLAREADCGSIRQQLSVLRGGARRRGELRHHVAQCEGCRMFEAEVRRQRAGMAVLLPVAPTFALKQGSLAAAFAAGGGGAAATGGGAAGGAAVGGAAAGGSGAGGAAVGGLGAGGVAAGGLGAGGLGAGGLGAGGLGAGGVTAGGLGAGGVAAAGGAAAGGVAAAGGAAGIGGSAVLTGGGALLGKVIGAKAVIALAFSGVAGGGYAAVQSLPDDRVPAPAVHATVPPPDQSHKPGGKPPAGGLVVPGSISGCPKELATAPGPCAAARVPTKADRDGDGIANRQDPCPTSGTISPSGGCAGGAAASAVTATDRDGDGVPNRRDPDRDGDGVANGQDPCPNAAATGTDCPGGAVVDPVSAGPTATDRDGDGVPNREDPDRDGDGVANGQDPCPNVAAPGTGCPEGAAVDPGSAGSTATDRDGDGVPNRKDPDRDGDGIANGQDACPNRPASTSNGCPGGSPRPADPAPAAQESCPASASGTAGGCPARPPADSPAVAGQSACPSDSAGTAGDCTAGPPSDPAGAGPSPTATPTPTPTPTPAPNSTPTDIDGDGIPNRQDPDMDGDGVPNAEDNDRDGDGIRNRPDACPNKPANTPNGCPAGAAPGPAAAGGG